jgi:hypothetical protein
MITDQMPSALWNVLDGEVLLSANPAVLSIHSTRPAFLGYGDVIRDRL